jgi:hypothetical protein|tara:strand:+ start:1929 stop:2510 length:582 start_codon:yes stop_codon:yes gene_type:complete
MFSFYVYYDDISGQLLSVTNELNEDNPYIVISKEEYVNFVSGKSNLVDYICKVTNITSTDPPELVRKDAPENFDVDKSIHEITVLDKISKYSPSSFYIFQDKKKKKWQAKAQVSDLIRNNLETNKYLSQLKQVYITQQHNPNILIGELYIDMRKFAKEKIFDIKCDDDLLVMLDDVSLYCPVVNETFYHIVKE